MNVTSIATATTEQIKPGTRVLLRTSLNVPVAADGSIGDMFRLTRSLPTLKLLLEKKAKVVIVGYIGRAGDTLRPVCDALQTLLPETKISFFDGKISNARAVVDALREGECVMLENIRREKGEEDPASTEGTQLVADLAALADVFVDDAFAEAHRAYASNCGVANKLPSYAGLLFAEEVQKLSEALQPAGKSLAIIGGAKFETKEPLLAKLLTTYGQVLLGGALADDVLRARGNPVGSSLVSGAPVSEEIAGNDKLEVPSDAVVVEGVANAERTCTIHDIRANEQIFDIGPATAAAWAEKIAQTEFVLWNGPMGVYEKGFEQGTDVLVEAISHATCHAVIGGGDTAAAIAKFPLDPARVFISTGGGAMLQFLADGTLPAIEALGKK